MPHGGFRAAQASFQCTGDAKNKGYHIHNGLQICSKVYVDTRQECINLPKPIKTVFLTTARLRALGCFGHPNGHRWDPRCCGSAQKPHKRSPRDLRSEPLDPSKANLRHPGCILRGFLQAPKRPQKLWSEPPTFLYQTIAWRDLCVHCDSFIAVALYC